MVNLKYGHPSETAINSWHTLERPAIGAALGDALINARLVICDAMHNGASEGTQRMIREALLRSKNLANLQATCIRLKQNVQGGLPCLRLRGEVRVDVVHDQTRPR